MKRANSFRAVVAGAIGLLISAVTPAASFTVQRATTAADVRGVSPRATVAGSPFDDASNSLVDGIIQFYSVEDKRGAAVLISVHKNRAQNAVRIAFDDGQSLGSAADAARSSALAAPASAMADGVSIVTVRMIPRDAMGTPLGTGLSIALDTAALWPANVIGSVVDHGDGSYSVQIASSIPTTGRVAIEVEGVWLDSEPAFAFTNTGQNSQRTQAIDRLADLAGSGGQLEQLMEQFAGNAELFDKLDDCHLDLVKTLDHLSKEQDDRAIGNRLFDAIRDLEQARALLVGTERESVELLMDRLAECGRMIAVHHIAAAEEACGACGTVGSAARCGARRKLDDGVNWLSLESPQYTDAITSFAASIEQADDSCDGSAWRPGGGSTEPQAQ